MKVYLITFLLFISCWATAQQTTFNSREALGSTATLLTNVHATDSCYYACGIVRDTMYARSCFLWTQWDLDGVLENEFTICDSIKKYEAFYKTLHDVGNGEFVVAGTATDTLPRNFFMRFNLQGDIISYNDFANFYLDNHFFTALLDMTQVEDGFMMVANGTNSVTISPIWSNNFLIKVNEYGEEVWQTAFGTDVCDLGYTILEDQFSDDVYLFSSVHNSCLQNQFLTQNTFIYRIDANGNETLVKELGTIENPSGWCRAARQLDDGSFILATGKGYVYDQGVNHQIRYDNQLIKLNSNFDLEWEQTFATNLKSYNELHNVIELPDDNGFISVGLANLQIEFLVNPFLAQINKASVEGDSLWTRYYQWGNAIGNDQSHSFLDIGLAADGGFVCVGNSIDDTVEDEPTQQAWIIKLDEQGCLVPDCHLIIDTTDAVSDLYLNIDYSIFPNPTSNYINIHYKNAQHTPEGTFKILNTSGQVVYTIAPAFSDITLIIDCSAWERGAYFIQYESLEGVSRGRQVVIK